MKGKFKVVFILCMLVITVIILAFVILSNNNKSGRNVNLYEEINVIEENVTAGYLKASREYPFKIENILEDEKLVLSVKSNIPQGYFKIGILSPEKETVYEIEGTKLDLIKELDVYNGVWFYTVDCEIEDGNYNLLGILTKNYSK